MGVPRPSLILGASVGIGASGVWCNHSTAWGQIGRTGDLSACGGRRPSSNTAGQIAEHRQDWSETEIAAQVDCHHLLFYLSIVYRLLQSTAQPEAAESRATLQAWGAPKARFRRALALLTDSHLSEDPDIKHLQEIITAFRDASN